MNIYDYILSRILNGSPNIYEHLNLRFGNSKDILNAESKEIERLIMENNFPLDKFIKFFQNKKEYEKDSNEYTAKYSEEANEILNKMKIITISEGSYPKQLRKIPEPPIAIFVKGNFNFNFEKSIAIVGTRELSSFGDEKTRSISNELSAKGYTIISGLARGTDGIAHREAVKRKGKTIAVLATGINHIYPSEHITLSQEIIENGGALISETFSKRLPFFPDEFKRRNRIISGLSKAILIIEGSMKSGSFSQYNHAKKQNKTIFTLRPEGNYKGAFLPKKIIEDGYFGIQTSKDIISYLEKRNDKRKTPNVKKRDGKEKNDLSKFITY